MPGKWGQHQFQGKKTRFPILVLVLVAQHTQESNLLKEKSIKQTQKQNLRHAGASIGVNHCGVMVGPLGSSGRKSDYWGLGKALEGDTETSTLCLPLFVS